MQTLGLSETTPRTESRLRALFWPTIRNSADLDYITQQGFWICFVVASLTLVVSVFTGSILTGLFEGLFFFLAGVGVRERSRTAGIVAFSTYLLSALVLQRYTGNGFSVVRIIFLALLFANIRGNWVAAKWKDDAENSELPTRLSETLADKLVDQMPALLWPKARFVFYVLAAVEVSILLLALLVPRP